MWLLLALAGTLLAAPATGKAARTWLAPVAVPATGPLVGTPVVAMTPSGDAILVWARRGPDPAVMASVRPAGTAAWPAAVRLSDPCAVPSQCLHFALAVAVNAGGDAGVSWVEGTGTVTLDTAIISGAERPAGAPGFSAAAVIARPASMVFGLSLGIDGAGALTVVWNAPGGPAFAATAPPGGAWGAAQEISAPGSRTASALVAVGPGGDAVATWIDTASCRPTAAVRRGGVWEAPAPLDASPLTCPSLVQPIVTGAGDAIAVWSGRHGVDTALLAAERPVGAVGWSAPTALGRSDGVDLVSPRRLARGPGGTARAMWRDDRGRVLTALWSAAGWGPATEVAGLGAPSLVEPGFAVAGDGSVLAATGTAGESPTLAVSGAADGSFAAPVPIGPARLIGAAMPSVAADAAGEGVAAWSDGAAVLASDHTARPGAPLALGPARISRLTAPRRVPRGSLAQLAYRVADVPLGTQAVRVERRVGRTGRPFGTGTVGLWPRGAVAVRMPRATTTLRLRLRPVAPVGAPSPAVVVRTVRPARPRIAVGGAPRAIAYGVGAAWVLGDGPGGAVVRRLHPRTGRLGAPIVVGGIPRSITAGAGAVWVVRDHREVVRSDPATGAITAARRFCDGAQVAAGPAGVWVSGACDPAEPSLAIASDAPSVAQRVDPAALTPLGDPIRVPGAQADVGILRGRGLWLMGASADDGDDTGLMRVDADTGAPGAVRTFQGRFGVPLVPVSDAEVWIAQGRRITTAVPSAGRAVFTGRAGASFALATSGRRVWALERRVRRSDRAVLQRLVSFDLPGGRRRGPTLGVGTSPAAPAGTAPSIAVGAGAVWVLLPDEGAVVRVPVRRRGR
jgi:hypothetical protein